MITVRGRLPIWTVPGSIYIIHNIHIDCSCVDEVDALADCVYLLLGG